MARYLTFSAFGQRGITLQYIDDGRMISMKGIRPLMKAIVA
jgi:hypothetical protein